MMLTGRLLWPMGTRACRASCMVTDLIESIGDLNLVKSVSHMTMYPDVASPPFTLVLANPQ